MRHCVGRGEGRRGGQAIVRAAGVEYLAVGKGPPVVCLHGIGGGAESFRDLMDGLSGFRVISPNLPGYGQTEKGQWPPSFEELSARLAQFIDALALGPVHLVGQSIGGMIALDHGLRRSDQVRSLSLIGTTPAFGGRDDSFKKAFLAARLAGLDAGQSMAEMAQETAPSLVGPIASPQTVDDIRAILGTVPETTWRGILQCLVTFNRRDDLAAITQPCCLIAGTQDQNAPVRTMTRMAEKLPNAKLHVIEGTGHMINQEAPVETNEIIQTFLERQA